MIENSLRKQISWAWREAYGSRLRIAVACLLGVMRVATGLTFIWVSKALIDEAALGCNASSDRMISLSVTLATLMLVEMSFSLASSYIGNQTEIKVKNRIRARLYAHLLSSRLDRRSVHSGDLLNRLTEDVRVITDAICSALPEAIVMVVQLFAAFIFLWAMSFKLAMCVAGIMPACLLFSKLYMKRMRKITAAVRTDDSRIHSSLQEGIQHQVVVRTLECEPLMLDRLGQLQSSLYDRTMERTRFNTFSRAMIRLGFIGGYLTAFIWSVWHMQSGLVTFGMMTAFLQLVARIQNPLVGLSRYMPSFVHSSTSIDRLMELEAIPSDVKNGCMMISPPAGIRLTDIHFCYEDGSPDVFNGFSYDFKPGSKTVVMGETGVGKSTLIKLMLALITPQRGHAEIYSSSESAPVSASTRCNMVYVPQGNSLMQGTIRENLLLGNPDASDEALREALHTAVADFVLDLPDGLDTVCGEQGVGLSEGQSQRIAIARALLRRGSVLLLDEFNSSLDGDTAAELMKRLISSHPNSTIIFISHRPEVANFCDGKIHLR